jgi:hypothetical protein
MPSVSDSTILATFIIGIAGWGICNALFLILRKRIPRVYEARKQKYPQCPLRVSPCVAICPPQMRRMAFSRGSCPACCTQVRPA